MYTPVQDDDMLNEIIEARPYRLLRVGSFLLSKEGYKIFVHESERKSEPRLGKKLMYVSLVITTKESLMRHSYHLHMNA